MVKLMAARMTDGNRAYILKCVEAIREANPDNKTEFKHVVGDYIITDDHDFWDQDNELFNKTYFHKDLNPVYQMFNEVGEIDHD